MSERVDPVETSGNFEPRFHPPGDIAVNAVSTGQATTTVVAGVTGEKRVVTAISFNLVADALPTLSATTIGAYVIDGASGATTYLWQDVLFVDSKGCEPIRVSGLNIVGTGATALTIEFSKSVSGARQSVNMAYHSLSGTGS